MAAALAACSSVPAPNASLDRARTSFNQAQTDSQIAQLAPDELGRARESLRVAEKARTDGAESPTIDHLAYMTSQRVTIARETASSKAAQAVTAGAGAERDKLRLEARTNEANAATQQLAASKQSNASQAAELTAANAATAATVAAASVAAQRNQARVSDLQTQLSELNAKKTDRGMVVTLGDVLFASGKANLVGEGPANMVKIADFFRRNPQRSASIEGHTDSVGSASMNQGLSERRASSVKTALVDLGVPSDHLTTQAHGEDMPAATNSTAAGRQMNRRVEIVFAPQADDMPVR
jgi:outer membrane protein OmpA-like peptidoglycan-associated protein